jgi:glycosyltransferase involved in cell wall biosynthesis
MGMGHYDRLLIRSLAKNNAAEKWAFDITFMGREPEQPVAVKDIDPGLQSASYLGYSPLRLNKLPWFVTKTAIGMADHGAKPDLYHSLSLGFPCPSRSPAVYTIHDLPPGRFSDEGVVPVWAKQAAKEARAIITPSVFAKNEMIELLGASPEIVHVVQYGCEHDVFNPDVAPASAETLEKFGVKGKYLFYAGGFTRRKNVRAMLTAWAAIAAKHPDVTLTLAGPTQQLQALVDDVKPPQTKVLGYLPHETLRSILKGSEALVCPSIYEGFGLPPLEAMALGVPVVAVRAGAVPEVVADGGLLAEDGSAECLSAALESFFANPEKAQERVKIGLERAKLFSWDTYASRIYEIYTNIISKS